MMTLLNLLFLIVLTGIVLHLINLYVPMTIFIKNLLNIFVVIVLLIYILQFFGVINQTLPYPVLFHGSKTT